MGFAVEAGSTLLRSHLMESAAEAAAGSRLLSAPSKELAAEAGRALPGALLDALAGEAGLSSRSPDARRVAQCAHA